MVSGMYGRGNLEEMKGRIDQWMGRWIDEWMGRQMDGRTNELTVQGQILIG